MNVDQFYEGCDCGGQVEMHQDDEVPSLYVGFCGYCDDQLLRTLEELKGDKP